MGHLFYNELGNLGFYDTAGNLQAGAGLQNTGDFPNLAVGRRYWCANEYTFNTDNAWYFNMLGNSSYSEKSNDGWGLALINAQVTSAVPLPGAIWLLASGLTGLVALRRRK